MNTLNHNLKTFALTTSDAIANSRTILSQSGPCMALDNAENKYSTG